MRNTFIKSIQLTRFFRSKLSSCRSPATMASFVPEILPPILEPTAEPPPLFDGTISYLQGNKSRVIMTTYIYVLITGKTCAHTENNLKGTLQQSEKKTKGFRRSRLLCSLYVNYECPFCQRVWIVRNIKGLQDKIKLVAIHLQDKPAWYKEKVYPENKVPALEHNGKVIGESLDLIKYIDTSFEGPSLVPDDHKKQNFAEEMMSYSDTFLKNVFTSFRGNQPAEEAGGEFDYLEKSLEKFDDGPFFVGQFSQVDAAFVPFIERFHIFLLEVWNYDITSGRPKLASYIQELNKIGAYKYTKCDPEFLVKLYKSRYMASS